jgi:beta-lactamase class A
MIGHWTRRRALLALGATIATGCTSRARSSRAPAVAQGAGSVGSLAQIEASVGGRVGVFAMDMESGRVLAAREDERFAMCSTFKWALAGAILEKVDRAELSLDERVPYGRADLLDYAPVTAEHVAEGAMSVEALANAAVTVSDNTAANLLLAKMGGPAGLTLFFRRVGDLVTRLDRNEPMLNENNHGDVRDTTSPQAMVSLMRAVLCGDTLSRASRDRLLALMQACETGKERLRAGLPAAGWTIGDKTGTGLRGAFNDVAIAVAPGRAPVLIAAYLSDGQASDEQLKAAHVAIARLVAERFELGGRGPRAAN